MGKGLLPAGGTPLTGTALVVPGEGPLSANVALLAVRITGISRRYASV